MQRIYDKCRRREPLSREEAYRLYDQAPLQELALVADEVRRAVVGKDEVLAKVLLAILAGGHILLEDCPGVGKTTLALAFSKVLGLRFKRIQFTTDTLPSDITGFTVFNQQTGEFEYREGAANRQLLLADEINRTSPKTQSALLEVMEERSVTVDGQTHQLDAPFLCIATQNPAGAAGTQPLPDSQLDRFMVRLPIGYPSREDQIHIVQAQRLQNPLDDLSPVTDATSLIEVQQYLGTVHASDSVLGYAVDLCQATRELPLVELGVSPRGVGALVRMSRAHALLEQRGYVGPEDVQAVFSDVCAHRLVLRPQARVEGVTSQDLLTEVLRQVPPPAAPRWPHA